MLTCCYLLLPKITAIASFRTPKHHKQGGRTSQYRHIEAISYFDGNGYAICCDDPGKTPTWQGSELLAQSDPVIRSKAGARTSAPGARHTNGARRHCPSWSTDRDSKASTTDDHSIASTRPIRLTPLDSQEMAIRNNRPNLNALDGKARTCATHRVRLSNRFPHKSTGLTLCQPGIAGNA